MAKDLTQMTPPEIDRILYKYFEEMAPLARSRNLALNNIKRIQHPRTKNDIYNSEHRSPQLKAEMIQDEDDIIAKLDPQIDEIDRKMAPYGAEYRRRRWPRYYRVTSSSPGHVHRGLNCSTCHPTTEFAWLNDLSGKSSKAMVAQWGDVACTICFPEAPTMPEWQTGTKKRQAREAQEEGVCPLSGTIWTQRPDAPPDAPRRPTNAKCQQCGAQIKISPDTRKIRKHNYPKD